MAQQHMYLYKSEEVLHKRAHQCTGVRLSCSPAVGHVPREGAGGAEALKLLLQPAYTLTQLKVLFYKRINCPLQLTSMVLDGCEGERTGGAAVTGVVKRVTLWEKDEGGIRAISLRVEGHWK